MRVSDIAAYIVSTSNFGQKFKVEKVRGIIIEITVIVSEACVAVRKYLY